MANVILIGGATPSNSNKDIDLYITSRVNNPKILLFPTASLDSMKSINNLKKQFENYDYDFCLLYSNINSEELYAKLKWANILYFAGGNTINLVSKIYEYKLDSYILNTSKLLVGISAGAIMLSRYGMGDSYSYNDNGHTYNYRMVKGIGLLDLTLCPHYDNDDLVLFNDVLKEYNLDAIALENDTAIHINDNSYKVIKSNKKKSVYFWKKEDDYIMKSLYNNKKIACLGPKGTYCSIACERFINSQNDKFDINYYPTIRKTLGCINDNDYVILPFENTLDGYVLDTIDNLMKSDYHIIGDLEEKVEFAFVSNSDISEVENVYVQFKAKAECLEFLTQKNDFNLLTTESNMESLNKLLSAPLNYGAIIPIHKLKDYNFKTIIKCVDDKESNYTRFIVLSKEDNIINYHDNIKCSLGVFMSDDRAGLLFEFLKKFNEYGLNLNAILSRPTKEALGKYNFYMEIMAYKKDIDSINKCIKELSNAVYTVKNLGIYSSIE